MCITFTTEWIPTPKDLEVYKLVRCRETSSGNIYSSQFHPNNRSYMPSFIDKGNVSTYEKGKTIIDNWGLGFFCFPTLSDLLSKCFYSSNSKAFKILVGYTPALTLIREGYIEQSSIKAAKTINVRKLTPLYFMYIPRY